MTRMGIALLPEMTVGKIVGVFSTKYNENKEITAIYECNENQIQLVIGF